METNGTAANSGESDSGFTVQLLLQGQCTVCVIIQTIRQDRIRQTVLITKLHGFPLENVV